MQQQELRIGNKCLWDNGNGTFTPYTIENYLDLKYVDNLKPIELTEEILLKCGFVSRGIFWFDLYLDEKTKLTLGWHPDGRIDFEISINKIYFDISHIKYLHQLQNLYFCLTGKELEYKQ